MYIKSHNREKNRERKRKLHAVFINLKAAFGNVNYAKFQKNMRKSEIKKKLEQKMHKKTKYQIGLGKQERDCS